MIVDIKGASASWSDGRFQMAFDVVPEESSHLDLQTGEIFQSKNYAVLRKQGDKVIPATLFVCRVERNAAGAELPSEMRYMRGSKEQNSEIFITLRLSDDHLASFQSLVWAGRTPNKAVVDFSHDSGMEFGWEPDGSGQKWDNKKTPAVPIKSVSFSFDVNKSSADLPLNTEVPEGDERTFFSDPASVNFALLHRLSLIETSLKHVSRAVVLIALLLFAFALFRFWH